MAQRIKIPTRSAIAFAVAMAAPIYAQSTTAPTDWNDRIRHALIETGDLKAVDAELAQAPPTPQTRHAQIRVALEQGNFAAAEILLQQFAETSDAETSQQLSRVQEMLGRNEAARANLVSAIAATKAVDVQRRLKMRLALMAFDAGRTKEAISVLRDLVKADASAGAGAGLLASLYGQYDVAAEYFNALPAADKVIRFLAGNAELHAKHPEAARQAFEAALAQSSRPGDRAYATERLIAAARAGKSLSQLADAWLAQSDLPPERMMPLATVLRELGRTTDLLRWWRALATAPHADDVVLSDRFVNEILGAALAAGRADDSIAICNQMLAAQPDHPEWLTATLRAEIGAGHFDAADVLLRRRLDAAAEEPAVMLTVGHLAERFDRDEIALDAADRLGKFGGGNAIEGCLLAASVYDREADRVKVDRALQEAAKLALAHPIAAGNVSSALEAAGQDQRAIDLLQATTQTDANVNLLARLASLQIKHKDFSHAIPVLERVMHAQASEALRSQAAQRLLEAAVATHSTGELAQRLQQRIDSGKADAADLSLLVDARLAAGELDAAVNTLRNTPMLTQPDRLWRLSVLFLRNNRLDDADGSLRELVDADPTHATETLERLASVAIRRNRPADAEAAIDQLQKCAGSGPETIALMAGVEDRLGRTGEAADQYRRLLAAAPDNAADWLLWATAMSKSGRTAVARRRLEVLCGEATNDTVFAIAVDGLINLNAAPDVLRIARRDAMLRLVERPDQMILYHVLADLSDELDDPAGGANAVEAAVAVSDEERAENLRELMESATQNGMIETAVGCGRSLLALGDDFPPQLFLQLGQQLLMTGRLGEALRAFERASNCADPDYVIKQAADLLERYDEPAAALNMLRPVVRRRNADLDLRVAELDEIVGKTDDAYEHYRASADFALRDPAKSLDAAALGAVMSARSTQRADKVLSMLEDRIRSLTGDRAAVVPPPEAIAAARALRLASAYCNDPARADRADASILARWPNATAFRTLAVQDRVQAGRFAAADTLERASTRVPSVPVAAACQHNSTSAPIKMDLDRAAIALPSLIVRGDDDLARAVLAAVAANGDTSPAFRILMSSAWMLGDTDAATRLTRVYADAADRRSALVPAGSLAHGSPRARASGSIATDYFNLVDAGWRFMPDSARAELIDRIQKDLADPRNASSRATLSLDVLLLTADLGRMPVDTASLATGASAGQRFGLADLVGRVMATVPPAERPDALRAMCAAVAPSRQLNVLTAAVGRTTGPFDAATTAAIADLAAHVSAGQAFDWGDWFIHADRPEALRALAEAARRCSIETAAGQPAHSSDLAAAAAALANAGDVNRADSTAIEALDSMALYAPPAQDPGGRRIARVQGIQPEQSSSLRVAVAAMSLGSCKALLAKLQSVKVEGAQADQTWRVALRSVLLEAIGDGGGALDTLRGGLSRDPNDLLLLTLYRDRLAADGRVGELAELTPRLSGGTPAAGILRTDVTAALRSLFRAREVVSTNNLMPPVDFATPAAAEDTAKLSDTLRGVLVRLRSSVAIPAVVLAADPGGLPPRLPPASPLDAFTTWPGISDDVLRTLHCPTVNGPGGDWLAGLVVRAARDDRAFNDRVMAQLSSSCGADTLSPAERMVVANFACSPQPGLPPAVLDAMWPAAAIPTDLSPQSTDAVVTHVEKERAARWILLTRVAGPTEPLVAEPGPLDIVDDLRLAEWLRSVADRYVNAAAQQLQTMRATGRVPPRAINTRLVGARVAAQRGDIPEFASELDAILHDWAWQQAAGSPGLGARSSNRFDLSFALPAQADDPRQRKDLIAAADASLTRAADRWTSAAALTRAWATLGDWALTVDGPAAAEPILKHAADLANRQGNGEQALWVADLADRLGHHDMATRMQITLLQERCLPAVRIAPLLEELRGERDVALVDRLTADAATYCQEPQLQRLASTISASRRGRD